jgi:8-amino-7-oxononanoate synthase
MVKKTRRSGLSSADKAALLSSTNSSGGRRSRSNPTASQDRQVDPGKTDFATLQSYLELKTQRATGDLLGLQNPFYRPHEGRAGATTVIDGRICLNFSSYDYLGLNGHPDVAIGAQTAIEKYGTSVSASRITAGERPIHQELEKAIAAFHGVEDAVAFVSGHAANVNAIADIVGPKDLILHDAYIHNSVTVGAKLSGAARRNFSHNDTDALEQTLAESRSSFNRVLIIIEGLYSMDGDVPDLQRFIDIKKKYSAWLMVDEAHSTGVLGERGHGIAEHFNINPQDVDIWMGTLSKTLSACGGYIAGSTPLVELLKFTSPGFVYSVGMSPPLAGAALAAFQIIEREPERVTRLHENGRMFVEMAKEAGFDTGLSAGYCVVPIIIGDSIRTVKLTERLLERGINVIPIIYPAVAMKSGRLRFFITSEHTKEHFHTAITAMREELDRLTDENFGIEAAASALMNEQ